MSEQEPKAPTAEELKAAQERWQKIHDDVLVDRFRHYQQLAFRMIVGELETPSPGHAVSIPHYDESQVQHMAEMLFLLDVATGSGTRFRSRYAGSY